MLAEEILMVNDGSLLLKLMGGLLESKGYHVNLTDSPDDALVLLSTRHIVLVVMKLNSRQADRVAISHMIKELNGLTRLIIVGESTHLPVEIFEIEAEDYILLPCRAAEIRRRLLAPLETAPSHPVRSPEDSPASRLDRRSLDQQGPISPNRVGRLNFIKGDSKTPPGRKTKAQTEPWKPFAQKPSEV